MENRNTRFQALLDAASTQEKSKVGALLELKQEIAQARSRNFSFSRIAEFLKQVQVDVSADSVRRFCHEVLKEKPSRRSAKQKKGSSPSQQEVCTATSELAAPLTQAQQAQSNQVNPRRVGPHPEFLVARDDL